MSEMKHETYLTCIEENYPDIYRALSTNCASFSQLTTVFYGKGGSYPTKNDNLPYTAFQYIYPDVFHAFENTHGAVVKLYYCSEAEVAAVITDRNRNESLAVTSTAKSADNMAYEAQSIASEVESGNAERDDDETWMRRVARFLWGSEKPKSSAIGFFTDYTLLPDQPEINRLLIRCDSLGTETRRLLRGVELQECIRMIGSATITLLRLIDSTLKTRDNNNNIGKNPVQVNETLRIVEEQLDLAEAYHTRAAYLKAQRPYYRGMMRGIVHLLLFVMILAVIFGVLMLLGNDTSSVGFMFASLISGGIGAVISVLSRQGTGSLQIDVDADNDSLTRAGISRPIVGAVFGAAVYAIFASGAFGVRMMQQEHLLFAIAIGFIAGFSERWAPDIVAISASNTRSRINAE